MPDNLKSKVAKQGEDDFWDAPAQGGAGPAAAAASTSGFYRKHPPNVFTRDIAQKESPEQQQQRASLSKRVADVTTATTLGAALPAVAAAPGAAGAVAGAAGRGLGAMEGARYGGRLSNELGIGPWPGRVIGGTAGLFAPEAISKMSNPILRGIAGMLGKEAPAIMTDAEVEAAAQRQVSESMARGRPAPGQGSDLVDPTTFEKGYKPRVGLATGTQSEMEAAQVEGQLERNRRLAQQVGMWSAGRKGAGVP